VSRDVEGRGRQGGGAECITNEQDKLVEDRKFFEGVRFEGYALGRICRWRMTDEQATGKRAGGVEGRQGSSSGHAFVYVWGTHVGCQSITPGRIIYLTRLTNHVLPLHIDYSQSY